MEIIVILIGTIIGAVIGWNFQSFKRKGRFTRLDVNDDGSIWLEFDYKNRFGKISNKAKTELTNYLKENFKGLVEVNVTIKRPRELMICMKVAKVNDEPIIIWLEDQEKALTYLCSNY